MRVSTRRNPAFEALPNKVETNKTKRPEPANLSGFGRFYQSKKQGGRGHGSSTVHAAYALTLSMRSESFPPWANPDGNEIEPPPACVEIHYDPNIQLDFDLAIKQIINLMT